MSTSSNSPTSTFQPDLYATEFSLMLHDQEIVDRCAQAFSPDVTGTLVLHALHHVSQTITRLENELSRQQEERDELFSYAIENRHFRHTILPIVRYHRRQRTHPYSRATTPPSLQSDNSNDESQSPPPSTIEIQSQRNSDTNSVLSYYFPSNSPFPEPIDNNQLRLTDDLTTLPHPPNAEPGSEGNPIDVDAIDQNCDSPHPATDPSQ